MAYKFLRRFYDAYPNLPLDPDSEEPKATRRLYTDPAHIAMVAMGGFLGTACRYYVGIWLPSPEGAWPWAIFVVNLAGSFLLGFFLEALLRRGKDEGGRRALRLFFGTGFLGSFTTYSSLAVGTVLMHQAMIAVVYVLLSVTLGVAMAMIGIWVAAQRGGKS